MSENREYVHEVAEKVDFLGKNEKAQEIGGHTSKTSLIDEKMSHSKSTVLDGLKDSRSALTPSQQKELADICGFCILWPEWRDPEKDHTSCPNRRDRFENFKKRYLREAPVIQKDGNKNTERQLDVSLVHIRESRPESCYDQLASLQIFLSQSSAGQPWPISFELACFPAPVDNVIVAIRRGQLRLDCGEAFTQPLKERLMKPQSYDNHNKIKVHFYAQGLEQAPIWVVEAEKGYIGAVSLPNDFCFLEKLAPGDRVSAQFYVYVKDLELQEEDEADLLEENEQPQSVGSYSFIRPGYKNLGTAKQKILKRLSEMSLHNGANGWAMLCSDQISFQSRDEESEDDR